MGNGTITSSLVSPGLRFASNRVMIGLRKEISKVTQFTTNFTDEAVQPGTTLLIPVTDATAAAEFDRASNNYGTVNGRLMYAPMTFNKHPKHSFGFGAKDMTLIGNGNNVWQRGGDDSAEAVSAYIADSVAGLINRTNIPTSGVDLTEFTDGEGNLIKEGTQKAFSAFNEHVLSGDLTKAKIAGLRAVCDNLGIRAGRSVLMLNPSKFAELLSLLDANMYGGTEAIQQGFIPYLYGYKAVIEVNELTSAAGENLVGAIVPDTAIAVAGRVLPIMNPKLYEEVGTTTDDNSGLTIQYRRGGNWETDEAVATVEALFGSRLVFPTKICRLVSEATTPVAPTGETGETGPTGE